MSTGDSSDNSQSGYVWLKEIGKYATKVNPCICGKQCVPWYWINSTKWFERGDCKLESTSSVNTANLDVKDVPNSSNSTQPGAFSSTGHADAYMTPALMAAPRGKEQAVSSSGSGSVGTDGSSDLSFAYNPRDFASPSSGGTVAGPSGTRPGDTPDLSSASSSERRTSGHTSEGRSYRSSSSGGGSSTNRSVGRPSEQQQQEAAWEEDNSNYDDRSSHAYDSSSYQGSY